MWTTSRWSRKVRLLLMIAALACVASAHEHHDEPAGPYENNFVKDEPIDAILAVHIGIQIFTWGILFPAGMVLGLAKSRFHVPVQSVGVVLVLVANYLAHHHRGREFHTTAHSKFAPWITWCMFLQAACGVFLKLHVWEGTRTRKTVQRVHGISGRAFPVIGWTQMIFGGIASLGFCFGEHVGQCAAHFIMGSSFIGYGLFMLLMARFGASFLDRRRWSQDAVDSTIIFLWGGVNTFTEHRGNYWSHKDMQHVSLGVLWVFGGALGMLLGWNGKRTIVPGVIIVMTGFAMSAHAQALEFSTKVHTLFGVVLMLAGATRVIEICFVISPHTQSAPDTSAASTREAPLPDEHERISPSDDASSTETAVAPAPATSAEARVALPLKPFQHLPPFLLVLAGLTFLSATEEQMSWIASVGMDSTTYADILFSGAFAIYFVANAVVELYIRLRLSGHEQGKKAWFWNVWSNAEDGSAGADRGGSNGSTPYARLVTESRARGRDRTSSDSVELRDRRPPNAFRVGETDSDEVDEGDDAYWQEKAR